MKCQVCGRVIARGSEVWDIGRGLRHQACVRPIVDCGPRGGQAEQDHRAEHLALVAAEDAAAALCE